MEEPNVRIVWIWCHERGGDTVAQVSFEWPGASPDTIDTITVAVPMHALQNIDRFCGALLSERMKLAGTEQPHELHDFEQLGRVIRALEHTHQKIWLRMLQAARIHSANATLANQIRSWMCQNPRGDRAAGPPWEHDPTGGDAA